MAARVKNFVRISVKNRHLLLLIATSFRGKDDQFLCQNDDLGMLLHLGESDFQLQLQLQLQLDLKFANEDFKMKKSLPFQLHFWECARMKIHLTQKVELTMLHLLVESKIDISQLSCGYNDFSRVKK